MFPVLVFGFILVFVSCFDACFYSTAHAPRDAPGHTFLFSFISGMSILQFLKHMLK